MEIFATIVKETDKAILVSVKSYNRLTRVFNTNEIWIPKSAIEAQTTTTITVATWMVKKNIQIFNAFTPDGQASLTWRDDLDALLSGIKDDDFRRSVRTNIVNAFANRELGEDVIRQLAGIIKVDGDALWSIAKGYRW